MTQTTQELAVRLDTRIHAPIERVWRLVGTEAGVRRWQGATRFDPVLGGEALFYLNFQTGSTDEEGAEYQARGRIVSHDPPHQVAYTWRQTTFATGETWPADTLVTITLTEEAAPDLTLVRLVHSGFERLGLELAGPSFESYRQGWEQHDDLGRLKRLVEEAG